MSGKYSGMQAKIKEVNAQAVYMPCAAHSLNLVGQSAVDCCVEAVNFFGILQRLYVFFSSATKRWKLLTDSLTADCKVPKRLSDTRWSAQADATSALYIGYDKFESTLLRITQDSEQNAETRHEAQSLYDSMGLLETAIMCELWNDILQRFNACSKSLQDAQIQLNTAVALLRSLDGFLEDLRSKFSDYEKAAIERCDNNVYRAETRRKRRRKQNINDSSSSADAIEMLSPSENFRINTFNVIINKLRMSLCQRTKAYEEMEKRFGFLSQYRRMSQSDINESVMALSNAYPADLEADFCAEFKQFTHFADTQLVESDDAEGSCQSWQQRMYTLLKRSGVEASFPNVEVALRIYLSLMVTNCSGERSFSVLKRIKNELCSTMLQERLCGLSLMAIESDVVRKMDFNDITDEFASVKARKKPC
jgi:hypothetical protein